MEPYLPVLYLALVQVIWFPLLPRNNDWVRTTVIVLVLCLTARYVYWRLTETLYFQLSIEAIWTWAFFLFEFSALFTLALGWFFQIKISNHSEFIDNKVLDLKSRKTLPSVDVMIVTYNENLDVLERTIIGATSMDYPNYSVWVLDDGKRDWLKSYCEERNIHYVIREEHIHAKAGNFNNGVNVSKKITNGELIMVLDADFVPSSEFLWRTIGFFDDEKIGIVQTPQHFFNPDPIQANLLADQIWVDEQRYFYDIVQPSWDAWNVSFCCGTSCVIRRKCLEEVGGQPTHSVCEDLTLTYALLKKGYITRYLNEPLSTGLSAEGISEFLTQRSRWCFGTLQLLREKQCPIWSRGYKFKERMAFLSLILHWAATFPCQLVCLIAPVVYFLTGIPAIPAQGNDVLIYLGPLLVTGIFFNYWLSEGKCAVIFIDITRLLILFESIRSIYDGLVHPKGRPFAVTDKGKDNSGLTIHWPIIRRLLFIFFITLFATVINLIPEYAIHDDYNQKYINTLWCLFNMAILLITAITAIDIPRRRKQNRFFVNEKTTIEIEDETITPCEIISLSLTGAKIDFNDSKNMLQKTGKLDIPGVGNIPFKIVRLDDNGHACIMFESIKKHRDAMIRKIYTSHYPSLALHAKPSKLYSRLLRSVFGANY